MSAQSKILLSFFLFIGLTHLCPFVARSQVLEPHPEPYRLDEDQGRDFEYSESSFLHRFTFRHRPAVRDEWMRERQGFKITAGSTRATEMYVVSHLVKDFTFEQGLKGHVEHRQAEDFDTQYERLLVGLEKEIIPDLSVRVLGDLEAEKEFIDIYYEVLWRFFKESSLRFSFVQVDAVFNRKTKDQQYLKAPFTFYFEAKSALAKKISLLSWININVESRREDFMQNRLFDYSQKTFGTRLYIEAEPEVNISVGAFYQEGDRVTFAGDQSRNRVFALDREVLIMDLEVEYELNAAYSPWAGVRFIRFIEDEARPETSGGATFEHRTETILFAGCTLKLDENLLFWPGIYIDIPDISAKRAIDEEALTHSGILGKITLPFEYHLSNYQAKITLNPTLEFPNGPFGGFNAQVSFVF